MFHETDLDYEQYGPTLDREGTPVARPRPVLPDDESGRMLPDTAQSEEMAEVLAIDRSHRDRATWCPTRWGARLLRRTGSLACSPWVRSVVD